MTEGLSRFRADMDKILQTANSSQVSSKVQRYLRAYEAGLPQDITVRWFPKDAVKEMEARVDELTSQNLEVWISQGLPQNSNIANQLTSVEKKTDLIKGLQSVDDFHHRAVPTLAGWEPGSWAKMFYDTPQRSLVGGTIRIDTNRQDGNIGVDTRSVRFEAASGISDVRDLDRQMSANQVFVVHPTPTVIDEITTALKPLDCNTIEISEVSDALDEILNVVNEHKSKNDPKAKPSEPKAVLLDFTTSIDLSWDIVKRLKSRRDTSSIPIVPIVEDESKIPVDLRPLVASFLQVPVAEDNARLSVFLTGFRLTGGPQGFQFPGLGLSIQHEIDNLLNTVFGPNNAYRRMMVQIANAEQRPTIAFEFKLVPIAPYDFFFLDYEWSGARSTLHRFDWFFNFGDGD